LADDDRSSATLSLITSGSPSCKGSRRTVRTCAPQRPPVSRGTVATYQRDVLLDLHTRQDGRLAGRIAAAHEGNVLEAINLAITSFDKHYIVRARRSRPRSD
jgi:hypothetical protein